MYKGTPDFSSLYSLQGYETSRKDDLESLSYLLVLLAKGTLPWLDPRDIGCESISINNFR
jgi:hypothetical protein